MKIRAVKSLNFEQNKKKKHTFFNGNIKEIAYKEREKKNYEEIKGKKVDENSYFTVFQRNFFHYFYYSRCYIILYITYIYMVCLSMMLI